MTPDQSARLHQAVSDARRIVTDALDAHTDGHRITGRVVLFSGGNDSTVLAHLFRHSATHAGHANTTIGIEATRQFVRDTCAAWRLPLLEHTPPTTYRDLVLEQGFPGPAMHFKMYQRLKERALRRVRRDLVRNPREERVLFIAGRRRLESARRAEIPEHERDGSIIWASPLANWSAADMALYRQAHPDVPVNPVAALLGMSGECLCGAFAEPGELDRVRAVDPDLAAEIDALEHAVHAAGTIAPQRCQWGWGAYRDEAPSTEVGRLCTSCSFDPAQRIVAARTARALLPALFDLEEAA